MLLPEEEFSGNLNNYLFDEGIAYCRKQQFEKAYQCFKKHLAQNSFCQETFQMLSYCRYKFSENLRNNVSDLSVITKPQNSGHGSSRKSRVTKNSHNASSTVLESSRSRNNRKFFNGNIAYPDEISFSKKEQKITNPCKSQVLKEKQSKSEFPLFISNATESHKVDNYVINKNLEKSDSSSDILLKQIADHQLQIEMFLQNIDSTLSNVESELKDLLTKERKVNADVLSILRFVSHNNETKIYQKQPVYFENVRRTNIATLCQPAEYRNEFINWSFPFREGYEQKQVNGTVYYFYDFRNISGNIASDITAQSTGDSCSFRQEHKIEEKSVSVESAMQLSGSQAAESSKLEKSASERQTSETQTFSAKRKSDFSEAYLLCSPRKKLQMLTLLNKAMTKRKSNAANKAGRSKRQKIQSSSRRSGKAPLLNCGDTFKMLKELRLMSDLSVCDINFGLGITKIVQQKSTRKPQFISQEICSNKVNLGLRSTRNAGVQTELSISCNADYLTEFSSDLCNSSSTVSHTHANSIIPVNSHYKKVFVPASSACTSNCFNVFINQILSEIKNSLSFIPMDFMPLNANSDSAPLSLREVKLALVPVSRGYFTSGNFLRLFARGHYIEFPNMRVYQVDPFWSRHSIRGNSRDQSLCLSESRSNNQSSFIYPVCILLHSLSTDLYNLTLLAGPFRIRFVNFNNYFNATHSSNNCDI